MDSLSMDNALNQAWATAPRTDADASRSLLSSGNDALKDSLKDVDRFLNGGGMAAYGAAPALPALPAGSGVETAIEPPRGNGLSSPANIFQSLGVDPNNFSLGMRHDEVRFKLSMEDEQMRTDTQGNVDYRSRAINLEVKLSTTSGSVNTANGQVDFERVKFELNFSYDEMTAGTGSRAGAQDAFGGKQDEFLKAVMEEINKLFESGAMEGDADSLMEFAENLGQKLFDLMDGVMQAGAEDSSSATYKAPVAQSKPAAALESGNSDKKLEEMQQVADMLTQQAAEMAAEAAEQPAVEQTTGASGADKSKGWQGKDTSVLDLLAKPQEAPEVSTQEHVDEPREKKPASIPSPAAKAFQVAKPQASAQSSLNLVA